MLLKDAANMIQKKFEDEFDKMELSKMTKFEISAMNTGNGYILAVSANSKVIAIISSKRAERRVFKTLDAIKRSLDDVGINRFEVIGTK
jgi:hypothetical protein